MSSSTKVWRSSIFHCLGDPSVIGEANSYAYFADGLLVVEDGHILDIGAAEKLLPQYGHLPITQVTDGLILPGFVDTHVHFPQTEMIASYGTQLLEWLNRYTFPVEAKFHDFNYSFNTANTFLDELLRNGTTTALVFGSVHKTSVDAFFSAADARQLRMICGKVMMDRNAPNDLLDTPESSYQDSKALIEKWHNHGRLSYAVTPRFAPTSSREQLSKAGQLLKEFEGLYLQTHLSENQQECDWVQSLFPESTHYLDVYDQHGLLGERSVFAHGIHLCDDEYRRLSDSRSSIACCPTSNLFLGSGLFNLAKADKHQVGVGLGTDVGGGTSFSMLQTQAEAYKVMQLQGQSLSPLKSFYLATLGGAKALALDHKIGNLMQGSEADFIILDYHATPLIKQRLDHSTSIQETLFVLMTLGDDRCISHTYSAGRCVHQRD